MVANQLNLYGGLQVNDRVCTFCGRKINENATDAFLKHFTHRCPECELEYLEIVFSLTPEHVEKIRKGWIK